VLDKSANQIRNILVATTFGRNVSVFMVLCEKPRGKQKTSTGALLLLMYQKDTLLRILDINTKGGWKATVSGSFCA
jgi:hypothetical protein